MITNYRAAKFCADFGLSMEESADLHKHVLGDDFDEDAFEAGYLFGAELAMRGPDAVEETLEAFGIDFISADQVEQIRLEVLSFADLEAVDG